MKKILNFGFIGSLFLIDVASCMLSEMSLNVINSRAQAQMRIVAITSLGGNADMLIPYANGITLRQLKAFRIAINVADTEIRRLQAQQAQPHQDQIVLTQQTPVAQQQAQVQYVLFDYNIENVFNELPNDGTKLKKFNGIIVSDTHRRNFSTAIQQFLHITSDRINSQKLQAASAIPQQIYGIFLLINQSVDKSEVIARLQMLDKGLISNGIIDRLNMINKNWAIIARRLLKIKQLDNNAVAAYRLSFILDDDVINIDSFNRRLMELFPDCVQYGAQIATTIMQTLPDKQKECFGGNLGIVLLNASTLSAHDRNIEYPQLLKRLLMRDDEIGRYYVKSQISSTGAFQQLSVGDKFHELGNKYAESVFLNTLEIIYGCSQGSFQSRDIWSSPFTIAKSNPLFHLSITDLAESINPGIRFTEYINVAYAKLFDQTERYRTKYNGAPPYSFNGGVWNGDEFRHARSKIRYLFRALENRVDKYWTLTEPTKKTDLQQNICKALGYIVQGFNHCCVGRADAINAAVNLLLSTETNSISVQNMANSTISQCVQRYCFEIFQFVAPKEGIQLKYKSIGNVKYINPNGVRLIVEDTMRRKTMLEVANGAFGMPLPDLGNLHGWRGFGSHLNMYFLSRLDNPLIVKALKLLYDNDDTKQYGADIDLAEQTISLSENTKFYNWDNTQFVFTNDGSSNVIVREQGRHMTDSDINKIIKTIIYGLMNDTNSVLSDICENDVFSQKIIDSLYNDPNMVNYAKLDAMADINGISNRDTMKKKFGKRLLLYAFEQEDLITSSRPTPHM